MMNDDHAFAKGIQKSLDSRRQKGPKPPINIMTENDKYDKEQHR
jgi:hypothetical protein